MADSLTPIGTDAKVSNTLVNSFDLLRLHKCGDRGQESKSHETPATKLPSYKAMMNFVQQDENISEYLAQERLHRAQKRVRHYR